MSAIRWGVDLIGYARVSTADQHAAAQHDALTRAGCERIFTDTASGRVAQRPALGEMLAYLRDGQDSVVITRLDRLGRSVINLRGLADTLASRAIGLVVIEQNLDTTTAGGRMFFTVMSAIAEFERDLIVERTHEGLAAARARGHFGGNQPKLSADQAKAARTMYDAKDRTVDEIAKILGVSRSTIYRYLDPERPTAPTSTTRRRR